MEEKRKLRDKMALNMIIKGDTLEVANDLELFNIKKIKKKHVSPDSVTFQLQIMKLYNLILLVNWKSHFLNDLNC